MTSMTDKRGFLSIISSIDNPEEKKSDLEEKTIQIKNCIKSIQNNFIRIGWLLRDIRNSKEFRKVEFVCMGRTCKNIYEYAKQEFNFCKSTTASLIAIVNEFSKYRDVLDDNFQEYDYSQLSEMTALSKEQLTLCNPSMTVQEIRALKKIKKNDQTSGQNLDSQENSGIQPFYKLKNKAQRLNFIENYNNWKCVSRTPELNFAIYECKLSNGNSLICFETCYLNKYNSEKMTSKMLLVRYKDGRMPFIELSYTSYLAYITSLEVEFDPDKVITKTVHE